MSGFFFGSRRITQREEPKEPQHPFLTPEQAETYEEIRKRTLDMPEMKIGKEDVINHEGVGIVMRPTAEELNIMNEPDSIKQAKAAVAETLRNAQEPQI